jgi:hypothetical protein
MQVRFSKEDFANSILWNTQARHLSLTPPTLRFFWGVGSKLKKEGNIQILIPKNQNYF